MKQRYYPVSNILEEDMHRQVIEMLESGVIEPSMSAWSSPVVMIRKSNDKYRFCIDFRKLNAVSKADAYPLPYMDAILRKLKSAKYTYIDARPKFCLPPNSANSGIKRIDGIYSARIRPVPVHPDAVRPITGWSHVSKARR